MNREESKQQIIDRALSWMEEENSEDPWDTLWTGKELNGAISEMGWNEGGHPIDFDLGMLADSINSRWKERHPESPRPRKAEEEATDPETGESSPNGTPWLLPIANMPGYEVDPFGVPHAQRRQRVKGGPVSLDKFFTSKGRTEKGLKPRFVCGYRLRVGGKRKRSRQSYFAMARFFAEQQWLNGDEG